MVRDRVERLAIAKAQASRDYAYSAKVPLDREWLASSSGTLIERRKISRAADDQLKSSYVPPLQRIPLQHSTDPRGRAFRKTIGSDPTSRREFNNVVDQAMEDSMQTTGRTEIVKKLDPTPKSIRPLKVVTDESEPSVPLSVLELVKSDACSSPFDPQTKSVILLRRPAQVYRYQHRKYAEAQANVFDDEEQVSTNSGPDPHSNEHDQAVIEEDLSCEESCDEEFPPDAMDVDLQPGLIQQEEDTVFIVYTENLMKCSTIIEAFDKDSCRDGHMTIELTISNIDLDAVRFAIDFVNGKLSPQLNFQAKSFSFWFEVAIASHCLGLSALQSTVLAYLSQQMLRDTPVLITHDAKLSIFLRSRRTDPVRQLVVRATIHEMFNLRWQKRNKVFLTSAEHARGKFAADQTFWNPLEEVYRVLRKASRSEASRVKLDHAYLDWAKCDPSQVASEEITGWLWDQYDPTDGVRKAALKNLRRYEYATAPKPRNAQNVVADIQRCLRDRYNAFPGETNYTEEEIKKKLKSYGWPRGPVTPTVEHAQDILNIKFDAFQQQMMEVLEVEQLDIADLVSLPFVEMPITIPLQHIALVKAKLLPAQAPLDLVWPVEHKDRTKPSVMSGTLKDENACRAFRESLQPLTLGFLRGDFVTPSQSLLQRCISDYCQKTSVPQTYYDRVRNDIMEAYNDPQVQLEFQPLMPVTKPSSPPASTTFRKHELKDHQAAALESQTTVSRRQNQPAQVTIPGSSNFSQKPASLGDSTGQKEPLSGEAKDIIKSVQHYDPLSIARGRVTAEAQKQVRSGPIGTQRTVEATKPVFGISSSRQTNFQNSFSYQQPLSFEPPALPKYIYEETVVIPGARSTRGIPRIVSISNGAYLHFANHTVASLQSEGVDSHSISRVAVQEKWSRLGRESRREWAKYAKQQSSRISIPGVDPQNMPKAIVGIESSSSNAVQAPSMLISMGTPNMTVNAGQGMKPMEVAKFPRVKRPELWSSSAFATLNSFLGSVETSSADDRATARLHEPIPSQDNRSIKGIGSVSIVHGTLSKGKRKAQDEANDYHSPKRK